MFKKFRNGLKAETHKNLVDSQSSITNLEKRRLRGLLKKFGNFTPTGQILVELTDFDIGLGTITKIENDGVTAFDCIQITTDKIIIRAILPGHLSNDRREKFSTKFSSFFTEFSEND